MCLQFSFHAPRLIKVCFSPPPLHWEEIIKRKSRVTDEGEGVKERDMNEGELQTAG